jgi:oxygen-independent coproporphyrinogen-3 oxidase
VGEITRQCPAVEEFTIEVNPGQVEKKILGQLRRVGVNRLSIGAQSFTQNELKFLGRGHSVEHIGQAVREAKAAGFDNISLDLIFAIPGSTVESWKYSLQSAIDLGVQHISAYSLTYEEGTPLQQAVVAGEVVPADEEVDRAMYEMAIDELAKAGFEQYEISNFARKGFECRHNLVYWANGPYIGVGPGASSHWQGERRTNIADIRKYAEMVQANADVTVEKQRTEPLEIACETAVLNLRRRRGIDLEEFKIKTGFDATVLFAKPIECYKKMGLIGVGAGRVFLTRKALPIADSVLCDFSSL